MGSCISACAAKENTPDDATSLARPIASPVPPQGINGGVVHVVATARTPSGTTRSTQQTASCRHHHRQQQQHNSTARSSGNSNNKHVLRAISPTPQQQHQQHEEALGLSPRTFQQLQQLLPSAPLQHLAAAGQAGSRDSSSTVTHVSTRRIVPHSSGGDAASTVSNSATTATHKSSYHQQQHNNTSADAALSPTQVLSVCAEVVQESGAFQTAGITPLLLGSLCLIESGGDPHAKHYREHVGETAHGLCQMLLPTAQWLSSSQGFNKHGSSPVTLQDLQNPKTCVYFTAAYLTVLSHYGGSARSEGFVVRAYHAGPKGVSTAAAHSYLEKYLKAKHCLAQVAQAAAVTVAAAALAAQLQLPTTTTDAAIAADADAAAEGSTVCQGSVANGVGDTTSDASTPADAPSVSTDSSSSSSSQLAVVSIRRAAADLVATLCCSRDDSSASGSQAASSAAGHAARTAAGSMLAHVLPIRWGLGATSSRQQQQQQQGQHSRYNGSSDSALAFVPVSAADVCAAWQCLLCISPAVARAALSQAAGAAALAPRHAEEDDVASTSSNTPTPRAAAAAAGRAGASSSPRPSSTTSDSSSSSSAVNSQARSQQLAAAGRATLSSATHASVSPPQQQPLDCLPCVMHVVGHGETLQTIARVCNIAVSDLLTANPEVGVSSGDATSAATAAAAAAAAVHRNDCIAVPLAAIMPRLYVVQPGDTLHSIARAHDVTVGRVLAKNPELMDPARVQPGWVVSLPGLKGDSQVALPADWLSQTALEAPTGELLQQQEQSQLEQASQRQLFQRSPQQRQRPQAVRLQQPVPAVGSGAFLFTVGSGSSSSNSGR